MLKNDFHNKQTLLQRTNPQRDNLDQLYTRIKWSLEREADQTQY